MMARIRSIKPEFFRHEALQDLEAANPGAYCMLVFEGLWAVSDRCGRFQWRPRTLKLDILPFLNFDMAITLALLEGAGFLACYDVAGERYGMIPTWEKHQTGESLKNERERYPAIEDGTRIHPGSGTIESRKVTHETLNPSLTSPGSFPDKSGTCPPRSLERERERERELQQQRCETAGTENFEPLPSGAGAPVPPSPAVQAAAVEAAAIQPEKPKPEKPKRSNKRSQALGIAMLNMPGEMSEAFQRVCDAWPKEGWNFQTRSAGPRKTNLALAAERFKAICEHAPIKTDTGPLTAEDLADATLAWLSVRKREAGSAGVPNVPCIENFFSADPASKKHWQNALLDFFGVAG